MIAIGGRRPIAEARRNLGSFTPTTAAAAFTRVNGTGRKRMAMSGRKPRRWRSFSAFWSLLPPMRSTNSRPRRRASRKLVIEARKIPTQFQNVPQSGPKIAAPATMSGVAGQPDRAQHDDRADQRRGAHQRPRTWSR